MIEVTIPGRGKYKFEHLVLDLNGTVALDGSILEGVPERLDLLGSLVDITIVTADTRGRAQELGKSSRVKIYRVDPGDERTEKLRLVQQLGKETAVSVGNGSNDSFMLKESSPGICILGPEGASSEAMANSDLVTADINAALDLLLNPERLIASWRR